MAVAFGAPFHGGMAGRGAGDALGTSLSPAGRPATRMGWSPRWWAWQPRHQVMYSVGSFGLIFSLTSPLVISPFTAERITFAVTRIASTGSTPLLRSCWPLPDKRDTASAASTGHSAAAMGAT